MPRQEDKTKEGRGFEFSNSLVGSNESRYQEVPKPLCGCSCICIERQDKTPHDKATQDKTIQDKTRQDRQDTARQHMQDKTHAKQDMGCGG
jgi:hypothetical protein